MDLDDVQQFRNGVRTLVEMTDIVRQEVNRMPFSEEQAERMVMVYWRASITSSFSPDLASLMKGMLPKSDD